MVVRQKIYQEDKKGVVQKLPNANIGHFCPPPPYVTKLNVFTFPPPLCYETNHGVTKPPPPRYLKLQSHMSLFVLNMR